MANAERLARVLTEKHVRGDGRLIPTAFNLRDVIENGLSLVRMDVVDVVEFQNIAEDIRRTGKAERVDAAAVYLTSTLRAMFWPDGSRKLCVIDDPVLNDEKVRDNPAHAIAVSSIPITELDAKELRDELLTIFSKANSLTDVWNTRPGSGDEVQGNF